MNFNKFQIVIWLSLANQNALVLS